MTTHNAGWHEGLRAGMWHNEQHTSRLVDVGRQIRDLYRREALELVADLAICLDEIDDADRGEVVGELLSLVRGHVPGELSDAMNGLSDAARQALFTLDGRTGGPVGGIQQASSDELAVDPEPSEPAHLANQDESGDPEAGLPPNGDDPIRAAVQATRKRLKRGADAE